MDSGGGVAGDGAGVPVDGEAVVGVVLAVAADPARLDGVL